jgi:hypothetical protein
MGSNSITNQFRGSQIHEPTPDTAYHKRRRDDMRTRIKQYGFFTVAKEPTPAIKCSGCEKDLVGSTDWIRINGLPICGECLNARD